MVYSVSITKDFEGFIAILLFITLLDSAETSPNFKLHKIGHKMPYWFTKFVRNQSIIRLSLVDSKGTLKWCKEGKCEENLASVI